MCCHAAATKRPLHNDIDARSGLTASGKPLRFERPVDDLRFFDRLPVICRWHRQMTANMFMDAPIFDI